MTEDRTSFEFAHRLLEAALQHGLNSELDHEVGDLQTLFLACWGVMTPEQRTLALSDPDVVRLFDGIEYEGIDD